MEVMKKGSQMVEQYDKYGGYYEGDEWVAYDDMEAL